MSSWLTLALAVDDHTRTVLDLYLPLDAPSATAMAVAQTVLPKADWTSARHRPVWPMHGPPQVVQIITETTLVLRSRVFSERPETVPLAIKGIFSQLVRGQQQQSCDPETHDTALRDPPHPTRVRSGNFTSRTQRK